jgi:CHAT domain-containing protein
MFAAATADVLGFIGHGVYREKDHSSVLVLSLGAEVNGNELLALTPHLSERRRIAVVLSCWGASSDFDKGRETWEPDGIVYGLKAVGFDYIVSSLWPISPRMAQVFMLKFCIGLGTDTSIESAFAAAYYSLFERFGREAVVTEAMSLQLMA